MKKFLLLITLAYTSYGQAYPEMIRHNYSSCTACHFSPSGGGLLNQYGRTISAEVLSRWGNEKEARPFYGALDNEKLNSWLQVGGNIRTLQFHHESDSVQEGRTIPMQAGIEAAAQFGKWTVAFFFGKLDQNWKVQPEFVRYYGIYQISDELNIRFGRFLPNFGLNIPQHTFATRGALGFGQNGERDALEATWTQEKWNISFTGARSASTRARPEVESSLSTQINYNIADSFRAGVSYWLGAEQNQNREIVSLHTSVGFTEHLYLLSEAALQTKKSQGTAEVEGLYHFAKVGYEFTKGIHLQVVEEISQSNLKQGATKMESYGAGFLFYPRPHFEFETLYSKKKIAILNNAFEDYAYLLAHYYF